MMARLAVRRLGNLNKAVNKPFLISEMAGRAPRICRSARPRRTLPAWRRSVGFLHDASSKLPVRSSAVMKLTALRVQVPDKVPDNHILAQNLYHNYYYPKSK